MTTEAGSGHPTSSLSAVESSPLCSSAGSCGTTSSLRTIRNGNRFILSKGQCGSPSSTADDGRSRFFPREELMTLRKLGKSARGDPEHETAARYRGFHRVLARGFSFGVGPGPTWRAA